MIPSLTPSSTRSVAVRSSGLSARPTDSSNSSKTMLKAGAVQRALKTRTTVLHALDATPTIARHAYRRKVPTGGPWYRFGTERYV